MGISIDIPKAREIHKGELRIERKEKLEALDILFMKAQEAGEDTSDIVAKKQLLRDANRDDPPYNDDSYPGYDKENMYVGVKTPLNEI